MAKEKGTPEKINVRKPHPAQSNLTKPGAAQKTPFKAAKATANKHVK